MARTPIEIVGYSAELPIELHPGADPDEEDALYERVRNGLAEYEDALDPPLCVTLTRRGPLPVDAKQLEAILSICRDAVVDVLGVASDHPRVRWVSHQSEGPYALLVEVRPEPR